MTSSSRYVEYTLTARYIQTALFRPNSEIYAHQGGHYDNSRSFRHARGEIDRIDHEIITLITRRFAVTQWVGELKANHAKDAYDGSREERQRDVISEWADMYGMPDWLMQTTFSILREETRKNHREIRNSAHFNKAAVDPASEDVVETDPKDDS